MENILSVAIDAIKGKIPSNYDNKKTSDSLREAFIELNGGSTKLNIKTFRRGTPLFDLVEELLPVMIDEGIKEEGNPLFNLVEYRNINDGDLTEFVSEGEANFVVATVASGIQGVRRQRISGGESVTIPTHVKIARVYENLGRLLAGRIDFDRFVQGVATAFKRYITQMAYDAIEGLSASTNGLDSTYVYSGSFDEDKLVEIIEHVEASTGMTAKIYGTKSALRKIKGAVASDEANSDMYNLGYYGKFNGTDMICLKQNHKVGSSAFALSANKVWIIASSDQPVKVVNEGQGLLLDKDPTTNADLTQEYIYAQALGCGVICCAKLAVCTFS